MISIFTRRPKIAAAVLAVSVSAMLVPTAATAQESDGWKFRISPYLWALSLEGTTAAAGSDVPLDASFGDVLDLLNFALSANMEWNKGKWSLILDGTYADLEAKIETGGPIGGDVEIKITMIDAFVGYNVAEHVDFYGGIRFNDQDITIVPDMMEDIALGDDWTDFVLGVRFANELSDKWSFTGRFDVAVAGDSDSAWSAQVLFLRHIGENKHFDIGYRHYDVDYESGSGMSLFKWDVAHSGPLVGFSWEFGG